MMIIGLDPGLGCTGWGVIAAEGNRLSHVANGQVRTDPKAGAAGRGWSGSRRSWGGSIEHHAPAEAAVEEVFLNENPQSTLKLGQARGVVLLAAARRGLAVGEYAPRLVKKAVVGTGGADKVQVHAMVQRLLPRREDRRRRRRRRARRRDHPRPPSRQPRARSGDAA